MTKETRRVTLLARRIAAYAVDLAVILVWFVLTQQFLLAPVRDAFGTGWMRTGYLLELYTLVTISAPVWIYLALSESSGARATLGKRLAGLTVASLDGRLIGFGRAFLRAMAKLLPWEMAHAIVNMPSPMWIDPATGQLGSNDTVTAWRYGLFALVYVAVATDIAPAFFTRRMQCGHDLLTRTVVEPAR